MNTGKTLGSYLNQNQNQFQSSTSASIISAQNVLFAAITHLTQLYGPVFNWDESICLPAVAAMGQFVLKTATTIDNVIELSSSQNQRSGGQQTRAAA